jgi:K+-sensing histidine kinase KdpD
MSAPDSQFPRLVSLACHDLRTPLATVHGFARTLTRMQQLEEPAAKWLEMIEAASVQLSDLLDELSVSARIESGRFDPAVRPADSLELARAAARRLGEESVSVDGQGAAVRVEPTEVERSLYGLARCALRHGGLEQVELRVAGEELTVGPIVDGVGPIVLGEELKDLGAAVGVLVLRALRGTVELDGERLRVRLPAAEPES